MAKANKSSRSAKSANTAKHTKKNLGKRNNRTRRHRKGAKKGKNMKKGGFLFMSNYADNVSDEEINTFNSHYQDGWKNTSYNSPKGKFNSIVKKYLWDDNTIYINYSEKKPLPSSLICIAKKATKATKVIRDGYLTSRDVEIHTNC